MGGLLMKKICFIASECVPFIKTGGLADVVGSLPKYYDKEKYDVRVIIPNYACIPERFHEQMQYVKHFYMYYNGRDCYVGIMTMEYDGIRYYFVDNLDYFSGSKPYTDAYFDLEKFAFFDKAALAILPHVDFRPDIIHCHDWQTGLIPVHIKDKFAADPFYQGIKTVMTIHNLKFQGVWDVNTIKRISELDDYYFTSDKMEHYNNGNMLKGGIVYADYVTTVSNTYAQEIQTAFYGESLDGLMRARSNRLWGIVNGIDYAVYDPATDSKIVQNYNADNFAEEKIKNKRAMQKELGLAQKDDVMMIGIVSRLTDQKGFDLIQYVMDELCQDNIQLVVLGTGDSKYEDMFRHYAWKYPDKVSATISYNDAMSHQIYASCDAFLMPSLFEPCGLSQLMALRYGTVPIVRETGGLKDTVEAFNEYEKTGTGFSFTNYNAHEMLSTIRYAESVYYEKREDWNGIALQAMSTDYSWKTSAKRYEELYETMLAQ
jgi:starch synthase